MLLLEDLHGDEASRHGGHTDSKCMLSSSSLRGKAVMILTNGLCLGAAAAFDIVSMKKGC